MEQLLTVLEAEGCSITKTLTETMMGKEQFYVKMLKNLQKNTSIDKLKAAFDQKDVQACFAAAHDLKGMYATLGLTPLFEKGRDICELARAGKMDGFETSIPELQELHKKFLDIIAAN